MDIVQEGLKCPEAAGCVLLASPHVLIREGIAGILREAGFQVIEQSDTGAGLQQKAAQTDPDIVLLDCQASQVEAESIRRLTEATSGAVVILMRPQQSEALSPVVRAGARGCLSVNLSSEEFVHALRMLAHGDIIVSRGVAARPKSHLLTEQFVRLKNDLSYREREVLGLVGEGATNREIAEKLIVSEHTVKVHLRNILEKLDLRNRQQAAAYAAREGIIASARAGNGPYAA